MTISRSSYGNRRVVADAVRNTIRGMNLLAASGVVRVSDRLPQGGFGSTVDVPINSAPGKFKARSEGGTVAATDLGDTLQSATVDQASLGFKWTRGSQLSGGNPMVQIDENERLALPVFVEDKCLALASSTANAIVLTGTPTAVPTKAVVADLLWSFGDESKAGVLFAGHSATVKNVSLIENSTGDYIFKAAQENGPVLVHGRPMLESDAFPQYYEAGNVSFTDVGAGGNAVAGDVTTTGSVSRQVKKTLRIKIASTGAGAAATFQWALSRDGETPTYSTAVNLAASVALAGTDIVVAFNLAKTYEANDTWTFAPSSDILFARRDSMMFSFQENISVREQIIASEDAEEYWLHLYFAILALERANMSDLPGLARIRVKL